MIAHLLDEARLSDFLAALIAVATFTGALILWRRTPPPPISRRTLNRINTLDEREPTR